jgi:predicted TIM-barrel fold metal-dependent hydrolase
VAGIKPAMFTRLLPRYLALLAIPVALAAGASWFGCSSAFLQPLPAEKLIDLHCHTAGIGAGDSGCFVSPALRRSFKFAHYLKAFGTTEAELQQRGDGIVIDRIAEQLAASQHVGRAVILALDGPVDSRGELDRTKTEIYVPNEFVAAQVARHPNLLFGASVNPYRPDALQRLEWCKAHGAVLVKWLPSIQHVDPADPRLIPFYRKLVELDLPLLTHTGSEHSFTAAEDAYCDPAHLELALQQGVTVIAAHAATTGRYEGEPSLGRLVRLMGTYPTLYADISSLTQLNKHGHLERVLRRPELAGRLVYGTDYPLISIRLLVSPAWYPFRLTWTQRRAIGGLKNPWDRDVALKQALGVPTDLWMRGDSLMKGERR